MRQIQTFRGVTCETPIMKPVPPLPCEQNGSTIGARHLWVILVPHVPRTREEVHMKFVSLFGRKPDRLLSPEESKTAFWWLGWVTREESRQWMKGT